jgi:hypothetical protein
VAPTILHVFCDNVDGLLSNHSIEPDQPLVLQLLHEVGLSQEGIRGHAALLQALHCHLRVPVVVPWSAVGGIGGVAELLLLGAGSYPE